jgi:oxygen-independent coproporphyrinogen-3 oxidase
MIEPGLTPLGLYLHIPWCLSRCIYCDFNTYVADDAALKQRYQTALLRETREAGAALGRPRLATLFIGGGTPTTLPAEALVELVETVKSVFALEGGAEVTVEANPGDLTAAYLREIRQGGINRLSLGVQSFNEAELRFLSRRHRVETARQAVAQARQAGFDNISLDLMFNLPEQTVVQWQDTLQAAINLGPEHLSLYSLIIEPGTPLASQVGRGQTPRPDDDVAAAMYDCAIDMLGAAGYAQYEISNWVKDGTAAEWETPRLAAAHNLIYWRNQPYLGLGAGAFSTFNGERWMNVKRPVTYIARIEAGGGLGLARAERSREQIDRATMMQEHMLLGLRLVREGVSLAGFAARFGQPLLEVYPAAVATGLRRGLAEWVQAPDGPHLRLTRAGRFVANQIIIEFM